MDPWWQIVFQTLLSEFSDLADVRLATQLVLRLSLAACLGGILGYEREQSGKSAGIRTHMLVALGAALFVLVPRQAGISDGDVTRVIQGIVVGVGFLGAGTIIKGQSDEHVRGLTTAAGIWLTAAVGMTTGIGREATAVFTALLTLSILRVVPHASQSSADESEFAAPKSKEQPRAK